MSKLVNVRETEGEIKNGQSRETNNKTQDEGKQTKTNVAHYVLDTTIRKQTQITSIRHEPSYKQVEIKTNRTSKLVIVHITTLTTHLLYKNRPTSLMYQPAEKKTSSDYTKI